MNLFGLEAIDEKSRKEIARRSLSNLLTSYADEADVFNEIIQNSYDALVKAEAEGFYKEGEAPKITIVIGRRNEGHHYFFVADNGTGMSSIVAKNITVPGFSAGKKKGKTVGYKGVGASYFFAASQKVALRSIDVQGEITEYTVRGSYEWIKNEADHPPTTEPTCDLPESIKKYMPEKRGTCIYFQFHEGIKPKNLNNLVVIGDGPQAELKNWVCFLASKTALGLIDPINSIKINIEAVLDLGDDLHIQNWSLGEFNRESNAISYPFPHKVLRNAKSAPDIEKTPMEQKYKHNRKYAAVYKRWTAEEIINETVSLNDEEKNKLREHLLWVDGYLAYSTEVLREINARLGGRSHLIRHGMRIAVDGIPQGRNLDLALTSSQGLDRQSHIVISFKGLELDTGRKISADETVASAISKLGQRSVGYLKDFRWAMKKKDRPDVASDLDAWRSNIESRSQTSIVRELYRQYSIEPVFRVDPDNESEVIALFVSLVGQGFLKGYRLDAISGFARYDALCQVDARSEFVTNLEDSLSVRDVDDAISGDSKVLEFKYSFDDVIKDFEEKIKNPAEIDFLVCWDLPDLNVRRGRLDPTYADWRDSRTTYAGSYIWIDENEAFKFPVIALKNVVAEILSNKEKSLGKLGLGSALLDQMITNDRDSSV